ncbi:CHAT domain-containing protein [Nostoc sp. LEGE 06077]|uniref:effector-associated domain EAD1-containing protein n=1 Tax=Nostoc sp. LEGE 06077 TaxID=915325 RepID=UPI001881FE32|nr:effector-associated domain EAD1-containing protein [Nostoc sp. LEGE 06077]MBE9209704.1 CHAT domain-containing protein [Nostoc sp. LEGE 06077]
MSLSGQQRKELQLALIDAFPTLASLEQMLAFELDKNLRVIAGEGSLQDIVFKLIQTANSQGWVEDLVRAACDSNPGNPPLRAIAERILPNPDPETSSVSSHNTPQKQTNQQQKILILTAIPHGLRLDKEIREIEEAIRRATNRDLFEIRIRTAVRPQDIRRAIAEEQPQIVHFCGHGLEDGSLLLEDDGGSNKPVAPEGLALLFKLHADYVNCVLLNACHSEKTAIAISQYINYAIGMNQPIEDKAAIAFAQGFYDGLGYKNSGKRDVFQRAFDEGMVAIQLENISEGQIPVLKKNFFGLRILHQN